MDTPCKEETKQAAAFRRSGSRYKEFVRMHREFRHLTSLKRGGRAHDPAGILATKTESLPSDAPLVHVQVFIHIIPGARRMFPLEATDDILCREGSRPWGRLGLLRGNGLAALDYANTKFSRGYAATGVCLGVCSRHEIVQQNGAADLQVGERYANMDYCFASLLRHHGGGLEMVVSYDIVCQWSKLVIQRVKKLPPLVRFCIAQHMIRFAVPKLHIHSHTKHCQENYSLNYLPGVGRTDGEGIERPWANIGATATSRLLARRLSLALSERSVQWDSFEIFSSKQGTQVEEWKAMVLAFERDSSNPNPYHIPTSGITEHDVRLRFAQEEAGAAEESAEGLSGISGGMGPSRSLARARY
ncbi:CxC2 domain-containing protein [Salix suchowensis]|nr:CxC2 domain-containing protein [Salix suchowensis]